MSAKFPNKLGSSAEKNLQRTLTAPHSHGHKTDTVHLELVCRNALQRLSKIVAANHPNLGFNFPI